MDDEKIAQQKFWHMSEELEWLVTDAMCTTFKRVTGREPNEHLREAVWNAIRFNVGR